MKLLSTDHFTPETNAPVNLLNRVPKIGKHGDEPDERKHGEIFERREK